MRSLWLNRPLPQYSDSIRPQGGSRLLILAVGTAILVAVFTIVWLQSAKYEPLAVGKLAPDFSLTDLNDKPYRLSDFRGKVVFLNFWATWCKPCREEMPSMEILNKNFEKDGLVILAVSIDRVTTTKDIPPFVKGMNLTFPGPDRFLGTDRQTLQADGCAGNLHHRSARASFAKL